MKLRLALGLFLLELSIASAFSLSASYSNSSFATTTSQSTLWSSASNVSTAWNSIAQNSTRSANSSWASVESCNAAWQSYSENHITTSSWPALVTDTFSNWEYFAPANATPYTTLCDGAPRAHGTASWGYATSTYKVNASSTMTITDPSAPTPTCMINSKDCGRLWSSYDYVGQDPGCPSTCDGSLYTTDFLGQPLPPCYIVADSLQLAYWPVTVEGNICGNRSTITDGVASPRTASIWGTTVTSPGVIVSFHSIWTIDNCDNPPSMSSDIVTDYLLFQQSSQISSQCGAYHQGIGPGTQVNFADFNSPVPASAYSCMDACGGGGGGMTNYCSTMYDNFDPQLAFPTDVFNIRPEWKSCKFAYLDDIVNDPPTALTQVNTIATPTVPVVGGEHTTTAKPGHPHKTPAKATTTRHTTDPADPTGDNNNKPTKHHTADPATRTGDNNHKPTKQHTGKDGTATKGNNSPHNNSPGGNDTPHTASPHEQTTGDPAHVIVSILQHTTRKGSHRDPGGPADPGNNNGHPSNSRNHDKPDPVNRHEHDPEDPAITTAGSKPIKTVPGDPGAIVIGGSTTLHPGQKTRVDNTLISVGTHGVVVGSHTIPIPTSIAGKQKSTAILNLNGHKITAFAAGPSGLVTVDGRTLTSGQESVIDGHTISDAGTALVIDGRTTITFASTDATKTSVLTISGHVFTATELPNGNVIVDSKTLRRGGPAVTIDGVVVSDGAHGLLVGGRTVAMSSLRDPTTTKGGAPLATTSTSGAGSYMESKTILGFYIAWLAVVLLLA